MLVPLEHSRVCAYISITLSLPKHFKKHNLIKHLALLELLLTIFFRDRLLFIVFFHRFVPLALCEY